MGYDQSHHQSSGATNELRGFSEDLPVMCGQGSLDTAGNVSPQLSVGHQDSVCSDSEVPYVSYTVNKPIGDSPKKSAASNSR